MQKGLWLLFPAAVAFILRSYPYKNFTGMDGDYLFYGPDSYDHLRRIILDMGHFPALPSWNYYSGYPQGSGQIWAPLFDYMLSIIALIAGWGTIDEKTVHFIGFWLSPALSIFTIVLIYHAGSLLIGKTAAVASAIILAVLPGHIIYSLVSELDHHVAEPLIFLAIIIAVARSGKSRPFLIPSWSWISISMVFAILVWRGSVIFWGVVFLSFFIQIVADGLKGRRDSELSSHAQKSFLTSALLLVPICLFDTMTGHVKFGFGIVSWFHVILLTMFCMLLFMIKNLFFAEKTLRRMIIISIPAILSTALLIPQIRYFISEFLAGTAVISGSDPWLDSISELRPILYPEGKLDIYHVSEMLSFIYWLIPFVLLMQFHDWKTENYSDRNKGLLMVTIGSLFLLPLFRERYVHLTAIAVSLCGGIVFSMAADRLSHYLHRAVSCILSGILIVLLLTPASSFLSRLPQMGLPDYEKKDLRTSLKWLRENTPLTSHYHNPVFLPEYGVLSDWGIGAYIEYSGQRPSLATNFGWETHGLYQSASFLTHTHPESAESIIIDNNIRYLFLNDITSGLEKIYEIAFSGKHKGKINTVSPSFSLPESMFYRLYVNDGTSFREENSHPLNRYRLVYESPGLYRNLSGKVMSYYKIFEHVTGARVEGRAGAGTDVKISLRLESLTTGRTFYYKDMSSTDQYGRFSFTVPYATEGTNGIIRPYGMYMIQINDTTFSADASEKDIQNGNTILIR